MLLNKATITNVKKEKVDVPKGESFEFPERVLQFGTGVLLRGLPDYFIDKANKEGIFEGRIVVVKSTATGKADSFAQQDGLYTLCTKGIHGGEQIVQYTINNAISRVLAAREDWSQILQIAQNPDIKVVISNTTEVGIVASNDLVTDAPPETFPGKLLALLYERYQHFNGGSDKGWVILPTELIPQNGTKLKQIVLDLAVTNDLSDGFKNWLETANDFCNTLVDRIVPGSLPSAEHAETEDLLGYQDELMIMAEPFRLWAIESDSKRVEEAISFMRADDGIFLAPSIEKYKELKLRLLNGTHTMTCAIALLAGFDTVKEAMEDESIRGYVLELMKSEIGKSIVSETINMEEVEEFAQAVVDRFSNPFLEHKWENIALNYTSKLTMRNVPLLGQWYAKNTAVPTHLALGFAAYITLMNTTLEKEQYIVNVGKAHFVLKDEFAPLLHTHWKNRNQIVHRILADDTIWGSDLSVYAGFEEAVTNYVKNMELQGMMNTLKNK